MTQNEFRELLVTFKRESILCKPPTLTKRCFCLPNAHRMFVPAETHFPIRLIENACSHTLPQKASSSLKPFKVILLGMQAGEEEEVMHK